MSRTDFEVGESSDGFPMIFRVKRSRYRPPGRSTNARSYPPGMYHFPHSRSDPIPRAWLMACAVLLPVLVMAASLFLSGTQHPPPTVSQGSPYATLRALDPPSCATEDEIGCRFVGRDLVASVTCIRPDGVTLLFVDELGRYVVDAITDRSLIVAGALYCPGGA